MTSYTDSYEKLYESMKNRFTVVNENTEYTLGDYMLMKAGKKKEDSLLPVLQRTGSGKGERAMAMVVSYVTDKLTIKQPPVKDKTIKAFPFRTSASAFLSAVVACTFMLSFVVVGARLLNSYAPAENTGIVDELPETEAVNEVF